MKAAGAYLALLAIREGRFFRHAGTKLPVIRIAQFRRSADVARRPVPVPAFTVFGIKRNAAEGFLELNGILGQRETEHVITLSSVHHVGRLPMDAQSHKEGVRRLIIGSRATIVSSAT
jgi:hypothetical protein